MIQEGIMNLENYVIFKGTKDGVTVLFMKDAPFDVLCEQLDKEGSGSRKIF